MLGLELLEHRRDIASGEDVAGQQEHGQAIHCRQGCASDHVGCARSDRTHTGESAQPVAHLGIRRRDVHRGLFIFRVYIPERGILGQCLADSGDASMTKDAQATAEERLAFAIALDLLVK